MNIRKSSGILILMCCSSAIAATEVGGIINKAGTWTAAHSPYRFTSDVQIAYRTTLKIEPGVQIDGNGKNLEVLGKLYISGNQSAPVRLNNVRLLSGKTDTKQPYSMDIRFADFQGGAFLPPGGTYGAFALRDSVLSDLTTDTYIWYPTDDCYIERNQFVRTQGIRVGHSGPSVYIRNNLFYQSKPPSSGRSLITNWAAYKGKTVVKYNTFQDVKPYAVGLENKDSAMSANDNYWGTTDLAAVEAMIFDKKDDASLPDTISFKPVLPSPHPQTPKIEK